MWSFICGKYGIQNPMNITFNKFTILSYCVALSLLFHIIFFFTLRMFGKYNFGSPVNPLQAVMVDMGKPSGVITQSAQLEEHDENNPEDVAVESKNAVSSSHIEEKNSDTAPVKQPQPEELATFEEFANSEEPSDDQIQAVSRLITPVTAFLPPLHTAKDFLATKTEKLSYMISMLGVPVGSAELEAKNNNGEVNITLSVKSNAMLASVYPINNFIETRHIAGNFIITKIRQQEGSIKSDIGFTILLRDKSVFWIDRLKNRYSRETIPNSEVLDALSGFYFLRNKALQVGMTEILHIYDGDAYAPVMVEVVRREMIRLPNMKKVDALVVHPVRQNGETFRKTGDMLIWITNDDNKVPVKVKTSLPIGSMTVELVSAESTPLTALPPVAKHNSVHP